MQTDGRFDPPETRKPPLTRPRSFRDDQSPYGMGILPLKQIVSARDWPLDLMRLDGKEGSFVQARPTLRLA